jgi:hypothetical protein
MEQPMSRNILIMLMFAASLVQAAWRDYEETRDLSLDVGGMDLLRIETGPGSLTVTGVSGMDKIVVKAHIVVPDTDGDRAREIVARDMVLSLEPDSDSAELKSYFDGDGGLFRSSPLIDLEIRLPAGMSLNVEDSSGSIEIENVAGDIEVDDGSGSILLTEVGGNIKIRDGSGSIVAEGAGGDVSIVDGSGSVTVARVAGNVTIEDASGSIDVSEVAGDLIIPEDGSGSVNFADILGRVEQKD